MTNAVALQTPALSLSGLDLLGQVIDPTYGFKISALGDNLQPGDPEAIIASIQSQLQDGDLERIDRYGNRSATIPLVIEAPNSAIPGDAIAHGQQALDAACAKASPLTGWTTMQWLAPLAGAQVSVMDVVSATVSKTFDDLAELEQGCRYVTLTIHARPFVRPINPVTIAAQAVVGSTTTTVDDGTSLTNWSLLTAQPANGTNLVVNPNFEVNAANWSAYAGSPTIARVANPGIPPKPSYLGSYCLQVSGGSPVSTVRNTQMPVTAGTTYFAAWSSDIVTSASVSWYSDAGGTTLISGTTAVNTPGSGWQLGTFAATAPTGAVSARLVISQVTTGPTSWYLDSVEFAAVWPGTSAQVGTGGSDSGYSYYFDGDSVDTTAVTYAWTGTAGASTSTATVTTRTLAVVSGTVKGTLYSSDVASIRRTGAVTMSSLPYMKIVGTATINGTAGTGNNLAVSVADGGTPVSVISSSINPATGDFSILLNRPAGFATSIDITATWYGASSVNDVTTVAVDAITITDNPYGSAAIQTQTITVSGSQRTDVSLLLRGQDASGANPVNIGNEVLVYTAASGADGRATFGELRALTGATGANSDATAVSGGYDTLATAASGGTSYSFKASKLFPGNNLVFARVQVASAVTGDTLSFFAIEAPGIAINGAANVTTRDPRTGWRTATFTSVNSGATWPTININTWTLIPLGMLRLPPGDVQDPSASITVAIGSGTATVKLDTLLFCNADVGQASLVTTNTGFGNCSTVRLDAATLTSPQALCWVGRGPGTNLYSSGTFDSTTDSWASAGSVTATVARTTASPTPHDGAGELQVTWGAGAAGTGVVQGPSLISLAPSSVVTVGAWVQSASGQPTVQLSADDGSGGSTVTSTASTANGTWQFLSVSYTVPASGICRPRIINASTATAGQIVYVDTVTIKTTTDQLVADASRWFGEQHQALPGLLQIATVTPGCTTTRVSGTYYPKYHDDVASLS